MTSPTAEIEERKPWVYAFVILLLVSVWMLTMRLLNQQFLSSEFEFPIIYLPTLLAGIVVVYLTVKPGSG
ncbi:MAG TPA: hypothetical protein VLV31_12150 [Candidatus Acidoferrales bacterium]|nr:hypothetical protein [Candidatus Acidoferrales bacterium]